MIILFVSLLFAWLFFVPPIVIPQRLTGGIVSGISDVATELTSVTDAEVAATSLVLYPGDTMNEFKSVLIGNAPDLLPRMDLNKPTITFSFGWLESLISASTTTVIPPYLRRGDSNVIVVNWTLVANKNYLVAAAGAEKVGVAVADALSRMGAGGLNLGTLHLVGHSLGAQLCGSIGRSARFVMPRITGLDSAGPLFYDSHPIGAVLPRLDSTDAKFVDVIHTDTGFYGTPDNDGTANFYPNGGTRLQPGCSLLSVPLSQEDFCSHHRSFVFYAESLLNVTAFIGVRCDSYANFQSGSCSSNAKEVMGYATPSTASGEYYLQTNDRSPFGRGVAGET